MTLPVQAERAALSEADAAGKSDGEGTLEIEGWVLGRWLKLSKVELLKIQTPNNIP